MNKIIVFSQNLKLDALQKLSIVKNKEDCIITLTTHFLFENERNIMEEMFGNVIFRTFADYLTDEEMERCDIDAYTSKSITYNNYINEIRRRKNAIVLAKVIKEFNPEEKIILSDDLGIDIKVWVKNGFQFLNGGYYYYHYYPKKEKLSLRERLSNIAYLKKIYHILVRKERTDFKEEEVKVAYFNDRKYVFIGNMNRIGYRLDVNFESSEEECKRLNCGRFETKDKCTYMTTWHERWKCKIPDESKYSVRWAQDGYLPPNYSHRDYFFKPHNVIYYCWDLLGTELFKNQRLPYEMIPFRKKLYLNVPVFPEKINNILVVASGSGDWTALKNRSDDDLLVDAFVQLAKTYPQIHFTYRCHPTWVHPLNVGVNSIHRVHEYFKSLSITNITLSSNTPIANQGDEFQFSFSRSSLNEDLKNADLVFGEHSISMIDAAFMNIPFASVNLTKRRDFYSGISSLGFPHCNTIDDIKDVIINCNIQDFRSNYSKAIENYNRMTNLES